MATTFGAKVAKVAHSPSFVALAFRNGLEYRNADGSINSADDLATLYENLVNFGPVTSEFTLFICLHPASIRSAVSYVRLVASLQPVVSFVSLLFQGATLLCYAGHK